MKNCPMCGVDADDGVTRCECGYRFSGRDAAAGEMAPVQTGPGETGAGAMPSHPAAITGVMRPAGVIFLLFGLAVMAFAAFVFDPSIDAGSGADNYGLPSRVINAGRLQGQMMLFLFGGFTFLAGTILWVGGAMMDRLRGPSGG